jgi:hypothetical protein
MSAAMPTKDPSRAQRETAAARGCIRWRMCLTQERTAHVFERAHTRPRRGPAHTAHRPLNRVRCGEVLASGRPCSS